MKIKNLFLVGLTVFILTGCMKKELDFKQPKIQIPAEAQKPKANKGSLYSRKGGSLFADKKDLQIGDIIQVVINEALTQDSNNSRKLTSDSSNTLAGISIAPNATNTAPMSQVNKAANKLNSGLGFDLSTNSSSSFSGKNTTAIDEAFATTISVIIEQTYQNGNYFIKGSKEMLIDGQSQEIMISGVIRPYDISPDNSILSSQVANLKILYEKDGEENDVMHTPWGMKILRALWPF